MKAAIDKYGRESFSKEILCIGLKDYILDLEEKMIAAYDTTNTGYNICKGGKDYPAGHSIPNESTIQPVYISGLWFPNRKIALTSLNLKINTFYDWQRKGILGETEKPFARGKLGTGKPVFVKGFWFTSISVASDVLSMTYSTVYRQSKDSPYGIDLRVGSQKGAKSSTAKAVYIESVLYGSTKEAARETGFMPETIRRRINNNWEGYRYADPV